MSSAARSTRNPVAVVASIFSKKIDGNGVKQSSPTRGLQDPVTGPASGSPVDKLSPQAARESGRARRLGQRFMAPKISKSDRKVHATPRL